MLRAYRQLKLTGIPNIPYCSRGNPVACAGFLGIPYSWRGRMGIHIHPAVRGNRGMLVL